MDMLYHLYKPGGTVPLMVKPVLNKVGDNAEIFS